MANDKKGGGTGPTGSPSALERYLAKQKKDRAPAAPSAKPPVSGASALEQRSGVRTQFKHTSDPMSIPRPPIEKSETPAQPASLDRWEKFDTEPDVFERRALDAGVPVPPPPVKPPQASSSQAMPQPEVQANPNGKISGEFGTRLLAAIVDYAIVGAISYPARMVITTLLALALGPIVDRHSDGLETVATALIVYFYYGYFYSTKGASPGKLLLNLEVIDSESGGRLTPWKAFFREAIGKPISAIPFFMGYLIVLFRDDRKALHDLLFDTQVVSKK